MTDLMGPPLMESVHSAGVGLAAGRQVWKAGGPGSPAGGGSVRG